jgi:hypothetical protein
MKYLEQGMTDATVVLPEDIRARHDKMFLY